MNEVDQNIENNEEVFATRTRSREKRLSREDRIDSQRSVINFNAQSDFCLSESFIKKNRDHAFSFIAHRCRGDDLRDHFHRNMRQGWVPVTRTEFEEDFHYTYKSPLDAKRDNDEYVQRGGQYLMKRSREIHEQEKDFWATRNRQNEKTIRDNIQLNPQIPETYDDYRKRFGNVKK